MKANASKLTLGISVFSLIVLFYLACADEENCCSFPTDCSNMFRDTGISVECHQEVECPGVPDGSRPAEMVPNFRNGHGHVELVNVEIMYKVKCPPQFINEESLCERSSNLNYIGLNVTFRITGGSVEGIRFNLQTMEEEVIPIVGTLKKSCHNVNFNDTLTADMAGDRLFSYTNYVGLHPGLQYVLTAMTYRATSLSQRVVEIPHCWNMKNWGENEACEVNESDCNNFGKWNEDFFCSIPSPASFIFEVWVWQNLSTKVTVWPGDPQFRSYSLNLICKGSRECYLDEQLQSTLLNVANIANQTLHHQFSINLAAGDYMVEVFGQPDAICEADKHWGSMACPSAKCLVTLSEGINHCKNPHFCQSNHSKCVNIQEDHNKEIASCNCIHGFALNTASGLCEDINECNTNSGGCSSDATCENNDGSFTCTCNEGFTGNGFTCNDINECNTNSGGCSSDATCENNDGSFTCTCNEGFTGNGFTCNDINECNTNSGGCSFEATCENNDGSFTCTCNDGFSGNGFTCVDINECERDSSLCGGNGDCINTEGGAYCNCFKGYNFSSESFMCEDINECEKESIVCGGNGDCINTEGGAYCNCFKGYNITREKFTCEDINECESDYSLCGGNGYCINTEGGAYCNCYKGYQWHFNGEKFTCEDINECERDYSLCGGNGYCINREGDTAYCNCDEGYNFNREEFMCEAQMQLWMVISITMSVIVTAVGIISFTSFVMKKCLYHCKDADHSSEMQTVTTESQLAQFVPKQLMRPPIVASMEGGSEEPLMDYSHFRSI